jgi:hypothetical protein
MKPTDWRRFRTCDGISRELPWKQATSHSVSISDKVNSSMRFLPGLLIVFS